MSSRLPVLELPEEEAVLKTRKSPHIAQMSRPAEVGFCSWL